MPRRTGHFATQKKLAYLGFHFLDHPPYSPDLALSGLFPGPKEQLKGRNFSSDVEVIVADETWLKGQTSVFSDVQELEQRAQECIELGGEFVE
jgi:hypothetical protein